MKPAEWAAEFSRLINAGLQSGVPLPHVIYSLEMTKHELCNRQIMAAMAAQSAQVASRIVDSQGKPPGSAAGN
jgi:hypothetical protein